jgi:uncharacterized protein YqiB (DUF1249 family)
MVPNNSVQVDEDSIQTEVLNPQLRRFKLCVVKYQEEIFIPEHEGLKVNTKAASLLRYPAAHGLEHHLVA